MGLFWRRGNAVRTRLEPTLAAPSAVGAAAAIPDSGVRSPEPWFLNGFGRVSSAGIRVSEREAMTLPAVLQAVRVLSGVFAMTPLHYYTPTDQGRERAKDDPLYRLFHRRPNGTQSAFAFKELLLSDILLAGNFYAYVSRDLMQRPIALTRLNPLTVVVSHAFDRNRGETLFYDATLPDGTHERFSARDVWHVAGMTRNGLYGLNPVDYLRDAFGSAIATGEYASRFWANDAKPAVVLSTKERVKQEDKRAIRQDWENLHGGVVNAHGTAILDQDLKPLFLSHDNEKSQFVDTRIFQTVEVARALGVPPHLLFELSRSTNNNIEHQSLEFVTYHLGPHYERVASAATRDFAEGEGYFEFLTDALVRGDIKTRWEAYKAQRDTGVVNADEIRDRENMNRIGGRAGEERWRPVNMAISGSDPTPPATLPARP